MKTIALILGLALSTLTGNAQDSEGVTVTVTIENVLSEEGRVMGALHTEQTFMKGPGVVNQVVDATKGELTLRFEKVQKGTFALMLLHDKNENNRMDFEANGMPKENYATSGETTYGPPSFAASKFEVGEEDLEFRIRF
jgi:uncharacterized protein (DUF2141 family)